MKKLGIVEFYVNQPKFTNSDLEDLTRMALAYEPLSQIYQLDKILEPIEAETYIVSACLYTQYPEKVSCFDPRYYNGKKIECAHYRKSESGYCSYKHIATLISGIDKKPTVNLERLHSMRLKNELDLLCSISEDIDYEYYSESEKRGMIGKMSLALLDFGIIVVDQLSHREVAHEIGHILGLGHDPNPNYIMFETDNKNQKSFSPSDVERLQNFIQ